MNNNIDEFKISYLVILTIIGLFIIGLCVEFYLINPRTKNKAVVTNKSKNNQLLIYTEEFLLFTNK